jgi:HAD superfamily hydrolase (TIGR01484 family)
LQITSILSDYDGTLCPTSSLRTKDNSRRIPKELEEILWSLSEKIPTCIVSSKDFVFLHERTKFAHILACVLGIETLYHKYHHNNNKISNLDCITMQHLAASRQSLLDSSKCLDNIVKTLQDYRRDITVEQKYTSDKEILIGLTIDYRHIENWQSFKENKEPVLREIIQRKIDADITSYSLSSSKGRPLIQIYSSHPFLDIYGVECDKGLAFDYVLSQLKQKERGANNVMYLGDSENDNPAFRKSDISIGIRSDKRLNPKLDCKYMLDFNQLPLFLRGLMDDNLIFSEELLPMQVK